MYVRMYILSNIPILIMLNKLYENNYYVYPKRFYYFVNES